MTEHAVGKEVETRSGGTTNGDGRYDPDTI